MKSASVVTLTEERQQSSLAIGTLPEDSDAVQSRLAPDAEITLPELRCHGDFVAVVPIAPRVLSDGGIILPTELMTAPESGLVVGAGPAVAEKEVLLGSHVRFGARPAAELRGAFPEYGSLRVLILRYNSLLVTLPAVRAKVVRPDK